MGPSPRTAGARVGRGRKESGVGGQLRGNCNFHGGVRVLQAPERWMLEVAALDTGQRTEGRMNGALQRPGGDDKGECNRGKSSEGGCR